MVLAANSQLAGTSCRLRLVMAEVVVEFRMLMKFVATEAEADTDALVWAFKAVEALVVEADIYALFLASKATEALVLASASKGCLWLAATLPVLLSLVQLAAAWLVRGGLLPSAVVVYG
jgi:hypothetical protein